MLVGVKISFVMAVLRASIVAVIHSVSGSGEGRGGGTNRHREGAGYPDQDALMTSSAYLLRRSLRHTQGLFNLVDFLLEPGNLVLEGLDAGSLAEVGKACADEGRGGEGSREDVHELEGEHGELRDVGREGGT
jgi:hypothetical protein